MAISTRVVPIDADGDVVFDTAPCFFAGHDGGTVVDSLAGTLSPFYTAGTMPFCKGDFAVHGPANGSVTLYLDFTL